MELFKQFNDNPAFKKWLSDMVFSTTYNKEGNPSHLHQHQAAG
jgi:type I restriction enzyme R subunit